MLLNAFIAIQNKKEYVMPRFADYSKNLVIKNRTSIQIKKVFKKAGIQTNRVRENGKNKVAIVGYHSLRHTFISRHAELGTPLAVVQESVGHSSDVMTQHYQQINTQKVVEYAKNFKL
jgi:integrase